MNRVIVCSRGGCMALLEDKKICYRCEFNKNILRRLKNDNNNIKSKD